MRILQYRLVYFAIILSAIFFTSTNLSAQNYTLEVAADRQTSIPGGVGNFDDFGNPVSTDLGLSEVFTGSTVRDRGIYANVDGSFFLIADVETPIPGGIGNFTEFDSPVTLGNGNIAFSATGSSDQRGIYIYDVSSGSLSVAVDRTDTIPGGTGLFSGIGEPVSLDSGNNLAFRGTGSSGQRGLYTIISASLTVAVDRNDSIPGGTGNFNNFSDLISIESGNIAFLGTGSSAQRGLYKIISGTIFLVADENTIPPGTTVPFNSIGPPVYLGNGSIAFIGFTPDGGFGFSGIYAEVMNVLTIIADEDTLVPDGFGTFLLFRQPVSLGGGNLVFSGRDVMGNNGIYTSVSGVLDVAVNITDAIPGGSGAFTSFQDEAFPLGGSNGDIYFLGRGSNSQSGIYSVISGTIAVVVDENTMTPSGGTYDLLFRLAGLDGNNVTFFDNSPMTGVAMYSIISGVVNLVVDRNTPVPGGGIGVFSDFSNPTFISGPGVAFNGTGRGVQRGIYSFISNVLSDIADLGTQKPDSMDNFTNFSALESLGGEDIAFLGETPTGVYTFISGAFDLAALVGDPIPDGTEMFSNLRRPISLGGGNIAFFGTGTSEGGIYSFISGTLETIVDRNTVIPGSVETFQSFSNPVSIGGVDITFVGSASSGVLEGVYTVKSGVLELVANTTTPIPDGTGNFTAFGGVISLGGGDLAFQADGAGQSGIYTFIGGTLLKVADLNTPIPMGTGNFTFFDVPVELGNGDLAFLGEGSSETGIYIFTGGTFELAADTNTPIPGGSGNFISFNNPISVEDGNLAFLSSGPTAEGIYAFANGSLSVVVDTSTNIPMGSQVFSSLGLPVSLGDGDIAFFGEGPSERGVYNAVRPLYLDVTITGTGQGNVMSTPAGVDCGNGGTDCTGEYLPGTEVTLTAFADMDSDFTGWGGDCSGMGTSTMITVDADSSCTAEFTLKQFDVTVNIIGNGSGSVSSTPPGIDCPGDCTETYDIHTAVTLNDMPAFGTEPAEWSDNCPDGVIADLTEDTVCTATFTLMQFTLDINLAGTGVGNVSGPGIDCGEGGVDCSEIYNFGTVVDLTPTPGPLSMFVGFSGDPDCEDGTVTIDSDITCTAIFDLIPLILNPIFPGIANNINTISADQASPGGNVAFVWGFQPGSTTIVGPTCNGVVIDIANPRLLSIVQAGADQVATHIFFIPQIGDFELPIRTQAIDIPTCRVSDPIENIIRKE